MSLRVDGTIEFRFAAKWEPGPGGCWLWTASISPGGYGDFNVGRRNLRAHRVSYELHVGPIPDGLMVCHRCDVRHCVNPDHLFVGTAADNMQDASAKGRTPVGTRHPRALNADQVTAIRAAVAAGESQKSQAVAYGVSSSTIHRLVNGHRHSDTHDPSAPRGARRRHDRDLIVRLYRDEGRSMNEVARIAGCDFRYVSWLMKHLGIQARPQGRHYAELAE